MLLEPTTIQLALIFWQFEEYISAALASVKYRDFVLKGEGSGVLITGGTGQSSRILVSEHVVLIFHQEAMPRIRTTLTRYGYPNSGIPTLTLSGIALLIL